VWVAVAVLVADGEGVWVCVGDGVSLAVWVGVIDGSLMATSWDVAVGRRVGLRVAEAVAVGVREGVSVAVAVVVGVAEGVRVGDAVGVSVGVVEDVSVGLIGFAVTVLSSTLLIISTGVPVSVGANSSSTIVNRTADRATAANNKTNSKAVQISLLMLRCIA
jgi:hypothetical protein